MARVVFTSQLQRHVATPECEVEAATVRAALDAVFAEHAALRGYVLDDQGMLRRHVAVFVNGTRIRDRDSLSDPVTAADEIHVLQALSGG
ncbi:MAG: MoaD/ThiS family protein [Burkholderiales bacterium]